MAVIKAFRGILYSKQKIKNISSVTSPPYDVLTDNEVKRYERRHKFNIVRLIQSREGRIGTQKFDRYEMARLFFNRWREDKVLVQDAVPSIYLYEHKFIVNAKRYTRSGFISEVLLEDFSSGKVLPHENTFSGPIEDRFRLTVATKANLCSIFSIFSDPQNMVMELLENKKKNAIICSAEDEDGGLHKLYRISDPNIINRVKGLMSDKVFLIADGHHRYETALKYRDYVRSRIKNVSGKIPADYVMMYLTPMESRGLIVLPIYRLIKLSDSTSIDLILKKSSEYFNVTIFKSQKEAMDFLERNSDNDFKGFVVIFDKAIYLFSLKSFEIMEKFNQGNYSKTRLLLNVSILHLLFVRQILGMDNNEAERSIYYSNNLEELILKKKEILKSALVLLNPPTIKEIRTVAENNEKMPHKSTYFYPKLLSGLVIRSLEE